MEPTWVNPYAPEVTTTVAFITSEAQKLHDGIGGSSQFDQGLVKFVPFRPYLQLAEALQLYIPTNLRIEYEGNTKDSWHKLGDEIDKTFVSNLHRSMFHLLKDSRTHFHQIAGNSAAKRKKILDMFMGLRDALTRANPTERSFRVNQKVSDCADQLHQAVVESIEDMIFVTTKDKMNCKRKLIPKFKHKPPPPEPDEILRKVTESTNKFERTLGIARDQAIEETQMVGQYTAVKANYIHRDVEKYGKELEGVGVEVSEINGRFTEVGNNLEQLTVGANYVKKGVDENEALLKRESEKNEMWRQELNPDSIADKFVSALDNRDKIAARGDTAGGVATRENAMQDDQLITRNQILELLSEVIKNNTAENSRTKQERTNNGRRHRALISADRLFQVLAQVDSIRGSPVDLDQIFQHPNKDFDKALMQKSRFSTATQG
ncbi:uncharacterized protein PAC_10177 [Phialocephala subalpina]|uniref:Uncharacterized protein n=1 Tax=Phialocephala subalpina TaxID=576137 RepID=A0A1L7X5K4_9HELO|nr:uncharacterized protein PAC_10177 [Phialocephala subalpina]